MSVNNILHRDYIHELEALKVLIIDSLSKIEKAKTLEGKLILEHELIEKFEILLSLSDDIEEITPFDHPEYHHFSAEDNMIGSTLRVGVAKLKSLTQMYLDYFNSQKEALLGLNGAFRRTRQKLSTLQLWDRSKAKYFFSEAFYNLDDIDFKSSATSSRILTKLSLSFICPYIF